MVLEVPPRAKPAHANAVGTAYGGRVGAVATHMTLLVSRPQHASERSAATMAHVKR